MTLPDLIVQGPRVVLGGCVGLTIVLALWGRRRGWTSGRVLAMVSLGLQVPATTYMLGVLATRIALLVVGVPSTSIYFTSVRHVSFAKWLVVPAWLACLAAIGVEWHRHSAAGPAPALRRLGRWGLVFWLPVALVALHRLSDDLDRMESVQWMDLWAGESPFEFRAQAIPAQVAGLGPSPMQRVTFVEHWTNEPRVLGFDVRGGLWRWDPLRPAERPTEVLVGTPARMAVLWSAGLCALGLDGRASCQRWDDVPSDRGSHAELWPGAQVATIGGTEGSWGAHRFCALSTEGVVRCWAPGDPLHLEEERQPAETGVRAFTLGFGSRGCTAHHDGAVTCLIPGSERAGAVEGVEDAAALASHGALRCWNRAVGDMAKPGWKSKSYLNGKRVSGVAVGESHTCAVSEAKVYCWGNNWWGQLCDGTTSHRTEPVAAVGIADAVSVAVGSEQTCILRANGVAACCGKRRRWGGGSSDAHGWLVLVLARRSGRAPGGVLTAP